MAFSSGISPVEQHSILKTAQWAISYWVRSLFLDVHAVSRARQIASFLHEAQLQSPQWLPSRMYHALSQRAMVVFKSPGRHESHASACSLSHHWSLLHGRSCSCCDIYTASLGLTKC